MGKYDPLATRLGELDAGRWTPSFADVEAVLGAALPKSARADEAWWRAGGDTPHGAAWLTHGWSVEAVDLAAETVTFGRETAGDAAAGSGLPHGQLRRAPRPLNAVAVGAGLAAGAVSLLGLALALRLKRRG